MLSFSKNDFQVCYRQLSKVKRKNTFLFVDVSLIKLKVLYELKRIDEAYDEVKKFKEYLRKDRQSDHMLFKNSREFCRAFTLLLRLKQNPTVKNLNELQYKLSKNIMNGRNWIILKMNEINIKSK